MVKHNDDEEVDDHGDNDDEEKGHPLYAQPWWRCNDDDNSEVNDNSENEQHNHILKFWYDNL